MMKFIFYCLLAYLILRLISFFTKVSRPKQPENPPPRVRTAAGSGMMVKDEVCQTYLPAENALREVVDGEEKFYCSAECRRKALAARGKSR